MSGITHKVKVDTTGLKRGKQYIQEELAKAGVTIGSHLTGRVRAKMRVDTGAERRGTKWVSRAVGSSLRVVVSNNLVQAAVDETGAKWSGSMPPYQPGSRLYRWVIRKGIASRLGGGQRRAISARIRSESRRAGASREEAIAAGRQAVQETEAGREANIRSVTFLIARSIARRGLPRSGDALRRPFEVTRNEERPFIIRTVNAAFAKSVRRINS